MSQKSQISIFVLISFIILFLLIFLIFSNFESNRNEVEDGKIKINSEGDDRISFVKERVDFCVDRSLKRATITSGLRGGFIYNEGEYYFGGVIPEDTYTKKLFSNLDLNWNSLQSRVLVHSQTETYSPPLEDYSNSIYSHSIKEDFERFITYEFLRCLSFEDYENLYDFEYNDFSGDVLLSSSDLLDGNVLIENLDANIGDRVELDYFEGFIQGEIVDETDYYYVAKFDPISLLVLNTIDPQSLSNLSVINLNNKFKINVTFNIQDISAEVFYPVRVSNQDFSTSYENSKVTLNVRYLALLKELSKKIVNYKYNNNKSVNYLDGSMIEKVLSSSDYFRTVGFDNLEFRTRYILDDEDHKQYVYSIIDDDSMILGRPFVFNFGYENIAPYINFTSLDLGFDVDYSEGAIVMVASKNVPITYDLWNESFDEQIIDNWKFYFVEQHLHGSDADFDLTQEGMLTFKAKREKLYTYQIQITDGDAVRSYNMIFITGFPDNTNNQAFSSCIEFDNFADSLFPIVSPFDNLFLDSSTEYNRFYAYQLYSSVPGIDIRPSNLTLRRFCSVPIHSFPVKLKISNIDGSLISDEVKYFDTRGDLDFEVPSTDYPVRVSIEIVNSADSSMVEPFVVDVYPAQCLGPYPLDIQGISGDLSCCNLVDVLESNIAGTPHAFLDNVLDSGVVLDEDLYLGIDFTSSSFDYTNNILWEVFGNGISSLYTTHIKAECGGVYPVFYKNLKPFEGHDLIRPLEGFIFSNSYVVDPNIDTLKADYVGAQADVCEFGYVNNASMRFYTQNGLDFNAGFVNMNLNPGDAQIITVPTTGSYSEVLVLADDTLYVGDGNSGWFTSNFGQGIKSNIYLSKSYCDGGASTFSPKPLSPPGIFRTDTNLGECKDKFYTYSIDEFTTIDNDALCEEGEVCVSGHCVLS